MLKKGIYGQQNRWWTMERLECIRRIRRGNKKVKKVEQGKTNRLHKAERG